MGKTDELGSISAYLQSLPEGSLVGVDRLQEWWGPHPQTRSNANRFARLGYLAFAPDLHHGEQTRLGDGQNIGWKTIP
jgi:dienelactone hydrolase